MDTGQTKSYAQLFSETKGTIYATRKPRTTQPSPKLWSSCSRCYGSECFLCHCHGTSEHDVLRRTTRRRCTLSSPTTARSSSITYAYYEFNLRLLLLFPLFVDQPDRLSVPSPSQHWTTTQTEMSRCYYSNGQHFQRHAELAYDIFLYDSRIYRQSISSRYQLDSKPSRRSHWNTYTQTRFHQHYVGTLTPRYA